MTRITHTSKIIQFLQQSDMSYFSSFDWPTLDFLLTHMTSAVTCLENVGQLNEIWGKKLDINLLNRQPQMAHCKIMLSETKYLLAKTAVKSLNKVSYSSLHVYFYLK